MKGPWAYVSGLLDLPNIRNAAQQRAAWREGMATLSRACADDEMSPLEGLSPGALAKGIRVAIESNFVDDLDWLAPAAAGAALYALAAALPVGPEQRELGRRVIARLNAGNAETFVAIATRMALGTGKGLGSAGNRARLSLIFELPISAAPADGALALALCSSRDLAREWVAVPSTGSLPARRFTARLLERAAREAAKRAQQGDDHSMRIFRAGAIRDTFRRLLEDREGLVWRHVAVARGLVAPWVEDLRLDIGRGLAPDLSPTEWRRAATSVAAMIAVAREPASKIAASMIEGGMMAKDPGTAQAFIWGMARAGEVEPELAAHLLAKVVPIAPVEAAEGLSDILSEFGKAPFTDRAVELAGTALKQVVTAQKNEDDGAQALTAGLLQELSGVVDEFSLRGLIQTALQAFVTAGAREAHSMSRGLLEHVRSSLATLEALAQDEDEDPTGKGGGVARRLSFSVLRELDTTLLERSILTDFVRLGANPRQEEELESLHERLARWLLSREAAREAISSSGISSSGGPASSGNLRHPVLRMRRLRALLHLVDSDVGEAEGNRDHILRRWFHVVESLLAQLAHGAPRTLKRTMSAALARAMDALVRAEVLTIVDVLLLCAYTFSEADEFRTLAEASMDPELVHALNRYALFVVSQKSPGTSPISLAGMPAVKIPSDSVPPIPLSQVRTDQTNPEIAALEAMTGELFQSATSRSETLRTALVRLCTALKGVDRAPSLKAVSGENDALASLEAALVAIGQLTTGARQKIEVEVEAEPVMSLRMKDNNVQGLAVAVARAVAQGNSLPPEAIDAGVRPLLLDVPKGIAHVVRSTVAKLAGLAVERPSDEHKMADRGTEQLPAWVPPRRTLGGFYIVRSLGGGAAGTVFRACRMEERHDAAAECFALKVPDYSVTAARSLSEEEFMKMFRQEASALIALPAHPNLANFVTFDAGAKPKPILVMEMVEGTTLEHILQARGLDMKRSISVLDDVLRGLEAMHSVGVGHLDVKPSNVVLRAGKEGVLVDFGLSGRHIRPGCATGPYGAPEVWGAVEDGSEATPQAADVYAFGCMAFEVLTGKTLIYAENELALISMHIAHDGAPPRLKELSLRTGMGHLTEILFSTLRRDPANRPNVRRVRSEFKKMSDVLVREKWPLGA